MYNEDICAYPLIDVYEWLKKDRKTAAGDALAQLRRMLKNYGLFTNISRQVIAGGLGGSLTWPCVRMDGALWDEIRRHLDEYGYDPEWIVSRDGRCGLRGYDYNDGIPCRFDEILITYDGLERMKNPVPVRRGGKCALVRPDGTGEAVCPFRYDLLFREPYTEYVKYVAMCDGKFGIVGLDGKERVPCEMDGIFERRDRDGFLPLLKDGKWGIYTDHGVLVTPRFDELRIRSEEYLQARIGEEWGWVTEDGGLSRERCEAAFGTFYDEDR